MKIKIIAVPPGLAPEKIRQMWVGVEMQLATDEQLSADPPLCSFGTGENAGGFLVTFQDAIQALKDAKKDAAANFWEGLLFGAYLEFNKNVCQIVE